MEKSAGMSRKLETNRNSYLWTARLGVAFMASCILELLNVFEHLIFVENFVCFLEMGHCCKLT